MASSGSMEETTAVPPLLQFEDLKARALSPLRERAIQKPIVLSTRPRHDLQKSRSKLACGIPD